MTNMNSYNEWAIYTTSAYQPPVDIEKWKVCPKCGSKPRIWVFNNGRFAKCMCARTYGPSMARAESILSYQKRCGNTEEYDSNGLLDAWNQYVDTGITQKIPEEQW